MNAIPNQPREKLFPQEKLFENASKILETWFATKDKSIKWGKVETYIKIAAYLRALDSRKGDFESDYSEQICLGMNLFISFWKLNEILSADGGEDVKKASASYTDLIIASVSAHQEWIRDFIYNFGTSEIDLYTGDIPTTWVCGIRSGIQFLFDALYGYSDNFDSVLNSFEEDISEFDCRMKVWENSGCRDPLRPSEVPKIVPSGHSWWLC